MPQRFVKDPSAVLDYRIDWGEWLDSDTIATSTWIVPTGITKASDTNTTTITTIWLSGGTVGNSYALVNHIVTTGGREDDRGITIVVAERDGLISEPLAYSTPTTSEVMIIQKGDTFVLSKEDLGPISPNDEIVFTVKRAYGDADTLAYIQVKKSVGLLRIAGVAPGAANHGSITLTDSTAGNLTITITAEEMAKLTPAENLLYDIKVKGSETVTLQKGAARIVGTVTQTI
jgi:hypothetical protein